MVDTLCGPDRGQARAQGSGAVDLRTGGGRLRLFARPHDDRGDPVARRCGEERCHPQRFQSAGCSVGGRREYVGLRERRRLGGARPPRPISSVASLNCETELPNFLPFRGNTKAWLREIGKANNRMASLVGAVAFTGTLTRGSIGIIPATAETENTRRYREDRWLGNWIRTKIDGARVRDSNIASCRLMLKTRSSRQAHLVVSRQLFRKEFMIR